MIPKYSEIDCLKADIRIFQRDLVDRDAEIENLQSQIRQLAVDLAQKKRDCSVRQKK